MQTFTQKSLQYFLKQKTPQSHFKMIFKALLIHILSIHVTSALPVSLRAQEVSYYHTAQCKKLFNGI